jgi:hypothetical protein
MVSGSQGMLYRIGQAEFRKTNIVQGGILMRQLARRASSDAAEPWRFTLPQARPERVDF